MYAATVKHYGTAGHLFPDPELQGAAPVGSFYVAEDGVTFYVAEDGVTNYVQEH